MPELKRYEIFNGININTVYDNKFKTNNISVSFVIPLNKDIAASASILPSLLTHSCKKYPDFSKLNQKLNNLYNVNLYSSCEKIGDNLLLSISTTSINNKYTFDKENVTAEVIDLIKEILLFPKTDENGFSKEEFEIEKSQLLDAIDSEYNDKRSYAISKAISNMFMDNVYSIKYYGSREQVENLTSIEVYNNWLKILQTAQIEIFAVGEIHIDDIRENFINIFKNIERSPVKTLNTFKNKITDPITITEEAQLAQSKLVMCFNCNDFSNKLNPLIYKMLAVVLGGATTSKFFINIREKQSLCYYCQARFVPSKKFFVVDSGIETKNLKKTAMEILNEIRKLSEGDLTEDELNKCKLYITNIYKTINDIPSSIEDWYLSRIISGNVTSPEDDVKYIMNIKAQEIIDAAKTLILDTTFELKGMIKND